MMRDILSARAYGFSPSMKPIIGYPLTVVRRWLVGWLKFLVN